MRRGLFWGGNLKEEMLERTGNYFFLFVGWIVLMKFAFTEVLFCCFKLA